MVDYPYDDELVSNGTAPAIDELEAHITSNLSCWVNYLSTDPSLNDLKQKANKIMAELDYAAAVPATVEKAVELALAVDIQFERLGLWQTWYSHLLSLYGPAMDRLPADWKAQFYRMFVNYFLYRGDLNRANAVVTAILDLAAEKWNDALQDAMIGAAAVATSLEVDDRGAKLAQMLVSLANVTRNDILLGKSYGVLCQFYAERFEVSQTFVYGQMVYCIGLKTHHDIFLLNGLHYMALAFQVRQDYPRAIQYLERGMTLAQRTGDSRRLDYMNLSWGMCKYALGDFASAKDHLHDSINAFKDSGHYYAGALYTHGLCLLSLGEYEEAERELKSALAEWKRLKRPFDEIMAKHAVAELYSLTARHDESMVLAMEALSQAEKMPERAGEFYLKTLRADVLEYEHRRDADQRKAKSLSMK